MNKEKQIEITEKAIRSSKDNAGAFANLLNQEIKELQRVKAKQIEELAMLIKLPIENWLEDTGAIPCATTYYAELMSCINDSAEVVFNENYRKITENEVVISKEEYERLKKAVSELVTESRVREIAKEYKDMYSKETAEKIFKELFKRAEQQTFFDCRMALDLDNLAKEFGVEIKE